jgi:hypothetical protein
MDGEVYHSLSTKMVVLRLLQVRDIVALLRLGEIALKESHAVRAELLVCDARPLGTDAAGLAVTALLLHLLRSGAVRRVALLLADREISPATPEVAAAVHAADISWTVEDSFEALAQNYARHADEMRLWLSMRPTDFVGSYCGSTYSIAELACTVLRSSGNANDAEFDATFVADMLQNHRNLQGHSVIFDTSASQPVTSLKKYRFIFERVLMPLLATGTARTVVHVRNLGDKLIQRDAPPIRPLLASFQVQLLKAGTMGEALMMLHALRAKAA